MTNFSVLTARLVTEVYTISSRLSHHRPNYATQALYRNQQTAPTNYFVYKPIPHHIEYWLHYQYYKAMHEIYRSSKAMRPMIAE